MRTGVVRRLRAVEIECPEPGVLSSLWGKLFGRAVESNSIKLDAGAIKFSAGKEAAFTAVELEAAREAIVELCGVRFRLTS